jgi:CspA family cold shock protein
VRSLLADLAPPERPRPAADDQKEEQDARWRELWAGVGSSLLRYLEANDDQAEFERGFQVVRQAVAICDPRGRRAAAAALFGDFTRRAIAGGIDRTRFVDWFGPAELFKTTPRRVRGRVLYFSNAKGRGKILGINRVVYFVHFSALRGLGFRTAAGGELVEFTPVNGPQGMEARDVTRLDEADAIERDAPAP